MYYTLEIEIKELAELWEVEIDVSFKDCENEGQSWVEINGYRVLPNQDLPKTPAIYELIENAYQAKKSEILSYYLDCVL